MNDARLLAYLLAPIVLMILPVSAFESAPPLCAFRILFGIQCPGCGISRAVISVLHGDFASALGYNKAVLIVFPLLFWSWVKRVICQMKKTGGAWTVENTAFGD
jgi:hypothetical protein